jgi:hypothetical protein
MSLFDIFFRTIALSQSRFSNGKLSTWTIGQIRAIASCVANAPSLHDQVNALEYEYTALWLFSFDAATLELKTIGDFQIYKIKFAIYQMFSEEISDVTRKM